ncbi:MAG TPA: hypothetical protein DCY07_05905 [Rhodospirillaceae bacterium]|nr:hypothetical protein [Rhodospirillaceae bacterium]
MQHLNPYRFYELASKLHALFNNIAQNRVTEMFAPLTEAQNILDGWIKGHFFPLDTSKPDAMRLLSKIGNLFNKYYIDQSTKQLKVPTGEDRIDPHEMAILYSMVEKFEHALAAELTHAPTYTANKRGIYSTYDLIENAYQSFSPTLRDVMPEAALAEFNIAGRALAFGLGTASAVHVLRAIELVLKRYYEMFSGTAVAKNERSYSIYLKKLATLSDDETSERRPDKRLLQMLAQIKEHYRNPLTNPDSTITIDQATSLFGLATAAMTLMSEQVALGQKDDGGNIPTKSAAKSTTKSTTSSASKEMKADKVSDDDEESYDFRSNKAG